MPEPAGDVGRLDAEASRADFERERTEREAQWKERELALRERQAVASKWTTPIATAVAAGLLGLLGTLWNGFQNLNIERKKQEGTLILEAIKTGTGKPDLAAANLLFLDGAGLIALNAQQRSRLQKEAGTSEPVPSLPATLDRVTFESSPDLTPDLEESVTRSIEAYQKFLTGLGYKPKGRPIGFSIDASMDNMFYDAEQRRIVAGPKFARDTDAVLNQFTLYVLLDVVGTAVGAKAELSGLAVGLPDYLVASYSGDPRIGEVAVAGDPRRTKPYLRNLENSLRFSALAGDAEPHLIGETWGGALWDLRKRLGQAVTDRLVFTAWTRIGADQRVDRNGRFFVDLLLEADSALNEGRNRQAITEVFKSRGFDF